MAIDLYSMLGLGDSDGPGADPFEPEQTNGQVSQGRAFGPHAVECDRWAVRRGADLLKSHPGLGVSPEAAADFSAAAFEAAPKLLDGCQDADRHRFLAELLDSEAYRASHAHTALNDQLAATAAAEYASAYAALQAANPEGVPDSREGDRAVARAAKGAAEAVREEVEGMVQTCNGLGLTPGDGTMTNVDPHAAARVYKRVKNSHRLKRIMEMAGRFRRLAQSKQRVREVHGIGEVVDLTVGGELERMVPAELARFLIPGVDLDTYRRVLQRQATVREHRNPEPVGRGPVVVVVDECLHPDTLIPLADGRIVPICEVKPGDVAFSVDFCNGRVIPQSVGRVAKVKSPRELLHIRTPEGVIRVSGTHRFFVLRDGHIHEVRADDLRQGDRIAAPACAPVQTTQVMGSERWAEAIGGLMGDGNAWKDKAGNARIAFYEMDHDHMARHKAFWEGFGFRPKVKPKGVSQAMYLNSRTLHATLTSPAYEGLLMKQPKRSVPVMVQQWPDDMRRAFLRGLFDAEGSVGDHQVTMTMSSKTVILQVQAMLRRDKIITECDRQWSEKGAKWYPRLIIGDRLSLEKFESLIGFAIGVKKAALRELVGDERLPLQGRRLMVSVSPGAVASLMKDAAFRLARGTPGRVLTQERRSGRMSRYKLSSLLDGVMLKTTAIEAAIPLSAKDMIRKAGISRDVIAKETGLSDSQVQKLQNGVSKKAVNIAQVREFYGRRVKELRAEVIRLRAINSDDLYWTPVRSIIRKPAKVTHLYDLTMDGPNANYLTVNCVVHNSGSMGHGGGDKIAAAKGLALAMAWLAREQGRWCALQSFGGSRATHGVLLPPGRWDEEALLGWLERFMRDGATTLDVLCHTVPFDLWDQFIASGMKRGRTDVILITDGIVDAPANLPEFLAWKAREKARVLSIVIEADSSHGGVQSVSDEVHPVRNLSADSEAASRAVSIG